MSKSHLNIVYSNLITNYNILSNLNNLNYYNTNILLDNYLTNSNIIFNNVNNNLSNLNYLINDVNNTNTFIYNYTDDIIINKSLYSIKNIYINNYEIITTKDIMPIYSPFTYINMVNGSILLNKDWLIYLKQSPTNQPNSLNFMNYSNSSVWWFNGVAASISTNIVTSDIRIKKDINDIINPLDKLMIIKPKEYFLCDDKDYLKKYGIIAQDVKETIPEFVYSDTEYIANIYMKGYYKNENNVITIITEKDIDDNQIKINDEIKILLDNNDKNNQEFIIEDLPYNNRYKKRFIKVKNIIDKRTIEIYEPLELTNIEKDNLFIYGKKTNDFLKLDYNSIYSLNIAGTQELYKLLLEMENIFIIQNKQIEELEKKIFT